MFDDDDRPKANHLLLPRKLEVLSRDDLGDYLDWLTVEKMRAEAALESRGLFESAAAALFKAKD
ncbi:MAG: DUF1192 family protein [Rickettsiales bacterium]|nr:DUF1192 family protein [Rickettsiales bacterium]